MNKKHLVFGFLFLFIIMLFSGCLDAFLEDFEESDKFIYVSVTGKAQVFYQDSTTYEYFPISDMQVELEVVKAGAVKKRQIYTTNQQGIAGSIFHTVKAYNQQDVRLKGYIVSPLPQNLLDIGYDISRTFDSAIIYWPEINQNTDFGGTYHWSPKLSFYATKKDYWP
jgi:hypothetical protein